MGKIFVCRCEDVTQADLREAFEAGQRDLESLKRFTGFATGFCQGKGCIGHAARFLATLKGGDDVVADPPRTRPLLHPTEVGKFAHSDASTESLPPCSESSSRKEPE